MNPDSVEKLLNGRIRFEQSGEAHAILERHEGRDIRSVRSVPTGRQDFQKLNAIIVFTCGESGQLVRKLRTRVVL